MGVEIQVGGAWKEAADRTPVGLISAFGGTVAPDGWFLCDGIAKSRTAYADLYSVIGTAFGAGDGVSTFNLPNCQGVGLTGSGAQNINGRAKTGPALGAAREDEMQGHWHKMPYM
jgi:microcystin-dependent protein